MLLLFVVCCCYTQLDEIMIKGRTVLCSFTYSPTGKGVFTFHRQVYNW